MPQVFKFGPFELSHGALYENGLPVEKLNRQAVDVLKVLVENRHRFVKKEEIKAAVWGRQLLGSESSITNPIAKIKTAIGKTAIVTKPRTGYQFVFPNVQVFDHPTGDPPAPPVPSPPVPPVPHARLRLRMRDPIRTFEPERPSEWLNWDRALIHVIGREDDWEQFQRFLQHTGVFRWSVYFGDAGIGKTRLADHFARQARLEGWDAGFLETIDLRTFVASKLFGDWSPSQNTLAVVDYAGAASKQEALAALLELFASIEDDAAAPKPKVRLLLLDRQTGSNGGWLQRLRSSSDGAYGRLVHSGCYHGEVQVMPPGGDRSKGQSAIDRTRQIVEETFRQWSRITNKQSPTMPPLSDQQWRRVQSLTGNRPLYLQMAAINACESGSPLGLTFWKHSELLRGVVNRERDFIFKQCLRNETLRMAVEHVAALSCLAGRVAVNRPNWRNLIGAVLQFLELPTVTVREVERVFKKIFLTASTDTLDPSMPLIQPDLIAGAFAASVLKESENPPLTLLRDLLRLSEELPWGNVVRMLQDLQGLTGFEGIEDWLPPLIKGQPEAELRKLLSAIPNRSVSLHRLGLFVAEELAERSRNEGSLREATDLLALATHRSRSDEQDANIQRQSVKEFRRAAEVFSKALSFRPSDLNVARDYSRLQSRLSAALSNLGLWEDALMEAWRGAQIASGMRPPGFNPKPVKSDMRELSRPVALELRAELAECLDHVAIQFINIQDLERALAAADLAVELGKEVAEKSPEPYNPDFARYLNDLALAQWYTNDVETAIENCRLSATIQLTYALQSPDEHILRLSKTLARLWKLELIRNNDIAAEEVLTQLIEIYQDLSARQPSYETVPYFKEAKGAFARLNVGVTVTLDEPGVWLSRF